MSIYLSRTLLKSLNIPYKENENENEKVRCVFLDKFMPYFQSWEGQKKEPPPGRECRTRTHNQPLWRRPLYQLS